MRFSDKSRNIHLADLKFLPSDAASFKPSQAPLIYKEKRSIANESSKRARGLFVAASTSAWAAPITSMAGTLGPAFASRATRRGAASSSHKVPGATGSCGLPT